MTSRANKGNAATNVDFLLMFVAAIRAVVPGFRIESCLPPYVLRRTEISHEEMALISLKSASIGPTKERLEFESGMDLWTWVTNRYEALAELVCSLSEEQRATAQHLLDGMLREFALEDLADFAGRR